MVIKEKTKDKNIEIKFNNEILISSAETMFLIPKRETTARVGIDSKKEIFTESYLLNFNNLAAVIVIPDLLTPGISEIIWNNPIIIADLYVKWFPIFLFILNLSLMKSSIPNNKVIQPITFMFLNSLIKLVWTRIKPNIITGNEEIKILIKSSLFFINFIKSL